MSDGYAGSASFCYHGNMVDYAYSRKKVRIVSTLDRFADYSNRVIQKWFRRCSCPTFFSANCQSLNLQQLESMSVRRKAMHYQSIKISNGPDRLGETAVIRYHGIFR